MKSNLQIAAILNMAAGALYLVAAAGVFIAFGVIGGIAISQGEHGAAGVIGLIAFGIGIFLMVLGLPSVLGGWALYQGKSWAKPLLLVLSVLHLPNVPIGTALGIYTIIVLMQDEPARVAPHSMQPIV